MAARAKPRTSPKKHAKTSRKGATRKPAPARTARAPARATTRNGTAKPAPAKANGKTEAGSMLAGKPMATLTAQLVVDGAASAMAWYGKVFGAKELDRKPMPDGRIMHAVMQVGDTPFMISDSFPGNVPSELNGAYLHVNHKDIRAMWDRAMANGAKSILPLANQFWGDTYGQLRDPYGQMWSLGWPAQMTEAEKARLQREAMAKMAAPA